MPKPAKTAEQIVEELLAKAIPNGECLECHLACSVDRLGRERPYVQVGGRTGKKWGVPRLVLHIKSGPLDEDTWALHSCDNPKCINLDHLFKGTEKDNTQDMMQKGRHKYITGGQRKITDDMLSEILELHNLGISYHDIAARFRVSATTIMNNIKRAANV